MDEEIYVGNITLPLIIYYDISQVKQGQAVHRSEAIKQNGKRETGKQTNILTYL